MTSCEQISNVEQFAIWGFLRVRLAWVLSESAVAAPAGEQAPAEEAARAAGMLLGMPALLEKSFLPPWV